MTTIYFKSQVNILNKRADLLRMLNLTSSLPHNELMKGLNKIHENLLQLEADFYKKDYTTPKIPKL